MNRYTIFGSLWDNGMENQKALHHVCLTAQVDAALAAKDRELAERQAEVERYKFALLEILRDSGSQTVCSDGPRHTGWHFIYDTAKLALWPQEIALAKLLIHPDTTRLDKLPQWQPIETAPKDGTEIIFGFASEANIGPVVMPRVRSGKWLSTHSDWSISYIRGNGPTHWLPLPEPPAIDAHQEPKP